MSLLVNKLITRERSPSDAALDSAGADTFAMIEKAAQSGALGNNDYPEPTEEQKRTGDYLKGKITLYGMPIEIEQPRGSVRSGKNERTGVEWSNRMAAHYGEVAGTTGADNDPLDVFIGAYPETNNAYVVNQIDPDSGLFDEHKIMLCFTDMEQARSAYLLSFDLNWKGLGNIIPASVDQIKWWAKNGDTSVALATSALPEQGYEKMKKVEWSGEEPVGVTLDTVLYDIRRHDDEGLMLDSLSIKEILDDSDGVEVLDALVTPFSRLQRNMEKMQALMMRVTEEVRPVAMQITDPFKQRGVANVAVIFELSDGQTVSIFFHNPDATPNRMLASDELISWKWMLNKKDITIVAAPEHGNELSVREVARRVMRIAAKNSAAFKRVNSKRADRLQSIDALKETVAVKEAELKKIQHAIEVRKVDKESEVAANSVTVKRSPDFRETGDYIVSAHGQTHNISRDSESGWWYRGDDEGVQTHYSVRSIGFNKTEAVANIVARMKQRAVAIAAEPIAPVVENETPPSVIVEVNKPPEAEPDNVVAHYENRTEGSESFVVAVADYFIVRVIHSEGGDTETLRAQFMNIEDAQYAAQQSIGMVKAAAVVEPEAAPVAAQVSIDTKLEWEDAVYQAIESQGEMTRSDAQGIVMLQEPLLSAQFAAGASPADAAAAILAASEAGTGSLPEAPQLTAIADPIEVAEEAGVIVADPIAEQAQQAAQTGPDAASTADIVADTVFLQSIIDGQADIWDSELPNRLEASLANMQGDQMRMTLWNDAVNAYSKQMMAAAATKFN